jgi:amino acid adenylation domain-containing protein
MPEKITAGDVPTPPFNAGVVDQYALSPLQQGMLFHHLNAPEAGTDIEQIVCVLNEEVDPDSLRRAWERVVERHAVLRTRFEFDKKSGIAVQVVIAASTVPFEACDWRALPSDEQEQRFTALLREDRHRGMHIDKAPLLRLTLVRTDESEYRLLWTFHHLLLDGRSFPVVLNEVFAFYGAICEERSLELPTPRSYRLFIEWLQAHEVAHSEAYWRKELKGFTAATPLVVDRTANRENESLDRQGDHRVFVDERTTSALKSFAASEGVTLNTLLQAAWALLLSRYSGEENVAFGVVRACRKGTVDGAEGMVGLFINTLPFRANVPLDSALGEWLRQLRSQWIGLRDHEHTPLVQIQKWSDVPAGKPLFESILMFENYELSKRMQWQGGKWGNRRFRLYEQTGYPITLTVYSGNELCLQIEFDKTRFEPSTIMRMVGHMRTLLEGMLAGPQQRLKDIPMLSPAEHRQLIVEWNATQGEFSNETTHHLFEQQVESSPDAIAVSYHDQQVTYRELNARANQIAHYLRVLGVEAEDLVAICVERSADMVAALIGIWKAGAAYVPLDPGFPKERLGQILEDAEVKVLLTEPQLNSILPGNLAKTVYLNDPEIAEQRRENLDANARPENLAYVIFTSGSTGRPKGVQIEHRAVVNFIQSMAQEPGLTAKDILVAVTTFSFDIAGLELFLPLLNGARVVIADRQTAVDPRRLAQLLESNSATVMQATPSTWRMLIESGWAGRPEMKILCGGEAFPPELAKELIPRCCSLWNMYGPTETTIWSTISLISDVNGSLPIGRPIANTQVHVLDRNLQPAPIGVPGELFIGGAGVARGYWKRPELTAERFIPNPFVRANGARIYRTGDLCRWREDGTLECLGRNDQQVKIRGYRIELGDVESRLGTHPDVQQAVVAVQESGGDKKLIAYVIPSCGKLVNADELRTYLSERLPDYMVPPVYVTLDKLPLTPNGKVDRKALPRVEGLQSKTNFEGAAPANETEIRIAHIWEEILSIRKISRNSNFFDLGADSLSIMRARNRLEQVVGKEFAIVDIFRNPTVKLLAQFLSTNQNANTVAVHRKPQIEAQKEAATRRLGLRKVRVL